MKGIGLLTSIVPTRSKLLGRPPSSSVLRGLAATLLITATACFSQTVTTLATFAGESGPRASLAQGRDGNLYGTTVYGGVASCDSPDGCGTVFSITPGGVLTVLYNFCSQGNCADGYNPIAGLTLGADGNFYGTTFSGGAHSCAGPIECGGTVFRFTSRGSLRTLYSFCNQANCTDGNSPSSALLLASDGSFYGTTSAGGAHSQGTVYKITSQGQFETLYSFCAQPSCSDGAYPVGGLVRGTDGDLYGTTYNGGALGFGTIFKIKPGGMLVTLHSFDSADGANPTAALVQGDDGRLYGSAYNGGQVRNVCPFGCGTLYRLDSSSGVNALEGTVLNLR